MNFQAFKTPAKAVILLCFVLFVGVPLLVACISAVQHRRFLRLSSRGQQYYFQVAEACDGLIAKADPAEPEIRGPKLQSLPSVLRDLKPAYVMVYTNVLMMRDEGGLMSCQIIWAPDSQDASLWHLRLRSGDSRNSSIVFSKKRATGTNPQGGANGRQPPRSDTNRTTAAAASRRSP